MTSLKTLTEKIPLGEMARYRLFLAYLHTTQQAGPAHGAVAGHARLPRRGGPALGHHHPLQAPGRPPRRSASPG